MHACRKDLLKLCLCWAPLIAGCAGGPIPELAGLNPYYVRQWREDEAAGPTFYNRLHEFHALRGDASKMAPAEKEQLAAHLAQSLETEPNPLLRREMVVTLGYLATPGAERPLQRALHDNDSDIRIAACRAWGKRGGPNAVAALGAALGQDEDLDVRLAATEELGKFADAEAIRALSIALDDQDPALQYAAVQSLKTATGRDYGNSVAMWRSYLEGNAPAPPSPPSLVERMRSLF